MHRRVNAFVPETGGDVFESVGFSVREGAAVLHFIQPLVGSTAVQRTARRAVRPYLHVIENVEDVILDRLPA